MLQHQQATRQRPEHESAGWSRNRTAVRGLSEKLIWLGISGSLIACGGAGSSGPGSGGASGGSSGGGGNSGVGASGGLGGAGGTGGSGAIGGSGATGGGGCGTTCGENQICAGSACACADGFVPGDQGCVAAAADSPATHTKDAVCQQWKAGRIVTTPNPYLLGTATCDPGTLDPGGIKDALARINSYRWLVGVGAVTDDGSMDPGAQACAVIQAWNDPVDPHHPPPTAQCYTETGAQFAGMSNVTLGTGLTDAIDFYLEEASGGAVELGHRRWLLYPFLGKVGIGFVSGGDNSLQGLGQCLTVMDKSAPGPYPVWYAWPPPGYVPLEPLIPFQGTSWSIHSTYPIDSASANITVTNLTTGAPAPVKVYPLPIGFGDNTVAFDPDGWLPKAGEVYGVVIELPSLPKWTYEVRPIDCSG